MTESRLYKPILLLLVVAMLFVSGISQWALNEERTSMGLTRNEPLENAPPMLAFTTVALGGFRGLIANALWLRANDMQQKGQYFEMVQLADWITKLQPHFAMVWRHQAWNMAYNISIKFQDPVVRKGWVMRGVELLRDEGIRFNPHDAQLYHELGWIFQNKLGGNMDDAQGFFKLDWAYQMEQVLGPPPYDFERLINPQTEAEEETREKLREIYKMEPAYMRNVENLYGPLDWRLPYVQAIYWGYVGTQKARPGSDLMPLRRLIYQSMQKSFENGRLVVNRADGRVDFAPNIDNVAKVNESYKQMIRLEPTVENLRQGHQNFLKNAVSGLYFYNREREAATYWAELKSTYPETVEDWKTAEEYAVWRATELLANEGVEKYRAFIEGMLARSFYLRAVGEYDQADGAQLMAQKAWQLHQIKVDVDTREEIKARIQLEPFPVIRTRVLNDVLNPEKGLMSPALALQLRTELGLPAPASTASAGPTEVAAVTDPERMQKLPPDEYLAQNAKRPGVVVLPSGVQYRIIEQGSGPKPRPGLKTHIHYWEQTSTGKKIINTYTVVPAPALDVSRMVKGFQEVVPLMNQGSKWHVFVPPKLAYGEKGVPPNIPPNTLMVYEIHLVDVK